MLKRQRLNKVSLFLTESDFNSICWNKGWLRSHLITLVWLQFKQINNCDKGDDTTLVWDTIVYLDKKLFNLHRYRCASDIYQSYLDVFRCALAKVMKYDLIKTSVAITWLVFLFNASFYNLSTSTEYHNIAK